MRMVLCNWPFCLCGYRVEATARHLQDALGPIRHSPHLRVRRTSQMTRTMRATQNTPWTRKISTHSNPWGVPIARFIAVCSLRAGVQPAPTAQVRHFVIIRGRGSDPSGNGHSSTCPAAKGPVVRLLTIRTPARPRAQRLLRGCLVRSARPCFTDDVSEKSVAGSVTKVILLGCAVAAGALVGTIAVALAYREWVPHGPCRDVLPPASAQCAFPTAPGWLLVIGAISGAALIVLPMRLPVLVRRLRHRSKET